MFLYSTSGSVKRILFTEVHKLTRMYFVPPKLNRIFEKRTVVIGDRMEKTKRKTCEKTDQPFGSWSSGKKLQKVFPWCLFKRNKGENNHSNRNLEFVKISIQRPTFRLQASLSLSLITPEGETSDVVHQFWQKYSLKVTFSWFLWDRSTLATQVLSLTLILLNWQVWNFPEPSRDIF